MVKISTVIQIIFAEKFVSQDFTIRAAPGLNGPTNTCAYDEIMGSLTETSQATIKQKRGAKLKKYL